MSRRNWRVRGGPAYETKAERDARFLRELAEMRKRKGRRETQEGGRIARESLIDLLPVDPRQPVESISETAGWRILQDIARRVAGGKALPPAAALPVWTHQVLFNWAQEHDLGTEARDGSIPYSRYRYNPNFDREQNR